MLYLVFFLMELLWSEQAAQIGVHDLHFIINTTQAAFSSIPAFVCLASSNKCFEKKKATTRNAHFCMYSSFVYRFL